MSEILTDSLEKDHTPLASVLQYFDILKGENLQQYQLADKMLDDVLFHNTETMRTSDSMTYYAIDSLVDYQHRQLPERRESLNMWRKGCIAHVVRGMIQGKKFPLEQFDEAVPSALQALAVVDDVWTPNRSHRRLIRGEVMDVWRFERSRREGGDAEVMKRAAEVFKFVGRPRTYGRMMSRVARLAVS